MPEGKELSNQQVWLYESNEEIILTVLLMAGIHPEEEAGVFCLNQLMRDKH